MSDNNDISSSADNNKPSLLPEGAQAILQRGMTEGFKGGWHGGDCLNLRYK